MSVLIKGMKMPQTCTMCWLSPICPVWVKEVSRHKGYNDRLPDCPLVEVPTPHGRLIDADELMLKSVSGTESYHISAAPTIIEAEGGNLSTAFQSLSKIEEGTEA